MRHIKILDLVSGSLIGFSAFGVLMVSIMAFANPQSVMDLVQVNLPNNDAFSSIRGVYGGTGLTIFITFIYLAFKNHKLGLAFGATLWGLYALSRVITIAVEGPLGDFGQKWLLIESVLCVSCVIALALKAKMAGTSVSVTSLKAAETAR